VRVLRIISHQCAYFRSPLRRFRQRESASHYFASASVLSLSLAPIFVCFLSVFRTGFPSNPTNNSILLETGRSYHGTLFFKAPVLLILNYYCCIPLTAQIQLCSFADPGPSSTQHSHSYSGRFNPVCSSRIVCVSFRPTEHFSVQIIALTFIQAVLTLFSHFDLCVSVSDLQNIFLCKQIFNPIYSFQVVCVTF